MKKIFDVAFFIVTLPFIAFGMAVNIVKSAFEAGMELADELAEDIFKR